MKGYENIEALSQRVAQGQLQPPDHPMLGLIDLARLDLDELLNHKSTQELVNKIRICGQSLKQEST